MIVNNFIQHFSYIFIRFTIHKIFHSSANDIKQLEIEFVANNFNNIDKIHPLWTPDKELLQLYEDKKQSCILQFRKRYHLAAVFRSTIPMNYRGSLYLSHTKYHDIIFQSSHAKERLTNIKIATRINIDGTWTKIHGSGECFYNQVIMFHVLVHSPVIERTAKLIFIAAALTKGKSSERYTEIAKHISNNNPNLDHIDQLSSDFEIGLYSKFKQNLFTKAEVILCFFHMMQSFFRRVQV